MLVPVEIVAGFTAARFGWTWQQTLEQPSFLIWGLWRAHLATPER